MSGAAATDIGRSSVLVDGVEASYLVAGSGRAVLLLHGTYWSRVWLPVLPYLAAHGLRPVAVDLPGCGNSDGELTSRTAAVPELAAWVERFAEALGVELPLLVAGHDIGGAIAQVLTVEGKVARLALVNSVTYDSWPVPGVLRFRDPAVVARTTAGELVRARSEAVAKALGRPSSGAEIEEYVRPWADERVTRSWMALAGAADARYTLELVPSLRASSVPKLLVWGEDDPFQKVEYAERFVVEIPETALVRIPRAGHIPMENDAAGVADALATFFLQ